ncbi:MAG: hypothetical protein IPP17_14905 [Bacteroidetes bacterium]|nr:hypothetical protein [Bacteroidota bacterium]
MAKDVVARLHSVGSEGTIFGVEKPDPEGYQILIPIVVGIPSFVASIPCFELILPCLFAALHHAGIQSTHFEGSQIAP